MAGEKLLKNVSGVYCRLFDHRPIIQSECKYVVREFEGRRSDREVERLNESLQKVRQIEEEIPKCIVNGEHFEELRQQIRFAKQRCHDILSKEEEDEQQTRRKQIQEDVKTDWEKFQLEMIEEEDKIRKDFEQEAGKLRMIYGAKETGS